MKIVLVPVGTVDSDVLACAARCIQLRFACDVQAAAPIDVPQGAYDARRNQFSSVAFMLALARLDPRGADHLVGLTVCDLFIPMLTFVFGQAQLRGRVALVSLARLRQEFYGFEPDPELLDSRLEKELGHELGHSFGLIHCPHRDCVMSLATSIQDVDRKTAGFCHSCGRVLETEFGDRIQGRRL